MSATVWVAGVSGAVKSADATGAAVGKGVILEVAAGGVGDEAPCTMAAAAARTDGPVGCCASGFCEAKTSKSYWERGK